MNKIRIALETQTDVREFVDIANTIEEDIFLEDGTRFRADAKSMIGVMYGLFEFKELWVLSEFEHLSTKFSKFMM